MMGNPPLFDPARLESMLDVAGVDVLVLATAPNVRYATRYGHDGRAVAVVRRENVVEPLLLLPSSDVDYILEGLADGVQVRAHGAFFRFRADGVELDERESAVDRVASEAAADADEVGLLAEYLAEYGLDAGRIAVDRALAGFPERLPGADIQLDPGLPQQVRAVKTEEEVVRLAEAASVAEQAIEETVAMLYPGVAQDQAAVAFRTSVVAQGAHVRMDNVSFGRSAAFGNANQPSDRLEEGAIVRFDVGAVVDGYASDLSRCFAFGAPDERVAHLYAALLAGQQASLDLVCPGVEARELFHAAVRTVREEGIPHYERTNAGHGIGLFGDGYDPPLIASSDGTKLAPGMVLCVETPYYELGLGGLQVEDMVVVTDSGYQPLTRLSRELRTVG